MLCNVAARGEDGSNRASPPDSLQPEETAATTTASATLKM
jgi:hypothetical protein